MFDLKLKLIFGFSLVLLVACATIADTPTRVAPTSTPQVQTTSTIAKRIPSRERSATPTVVVTSSFDWELPSDVPLPRVPSDNLMTREKVELGRYLFYDVRLSGNGTQSCATCHLQKLAFTDGRRRSTGSTGDLHPRNAQTLTNVAWNSSYTWANPLLEHIEQQVLIPMFGEFPVELGLAGKEEILLSRLKTDARYATLFAKAFPNEGEPFTIKNIVSAISSFTRALVSFDSPYDRYTRGETNALSDSAKRGMSMFFSEQLECHHCHTGFNFSVSTTYAGATFLEKSFFNTGLYNIDGKGAYPKENEGVKELTNDTQDMGRFRPPTLRNVALTAPYMHDGSFDTLEEVIRFYERGGRLIERGANKGDGKVSPLKNGLVAGFVLSDDKRTDVLNFLRALTDETFINDPRFSDPFESK
jgi:cytochrome c peroxidase